jgi:AbrB family looped-hinge helix DNA binding protein
MRMIKANTQRENGIMALVRMLRGGQVTLPAEARRALKLSEGDYLDLEVKGGTVTLKPVTVIDRAEADRQLDAILGRVKYVGPEPPPSEDEVMDMVADEVREVRAEHAKGRSR